MMKHAERTGPGMTAMTFTRTAVAVAALAMAGCAGAPVAPHVPAEPLDRNVVPPLGPPPTVTLPPATRHTLSNGLEVIVVRQPELPVVDVELVVRAGAATDPVGKAGRAELTADLLDEGTATRDALALSEAFDQLGASLSTGAGWDASRVRLHVLSGRLAPALELFGDIVRNSAFAQTEFDRKRSETLTAILQEQDEPASLARDAFAELVYGAAHPYGLPLMGTRSTVEGLTRADVLDYYRTWYRPNNAFMVVVGDVRAESLVPMLERALGAWRRADVPATSLPGAPAAVPTAIHIVDKPGAAQSEIRIGQVGVARSTMDYFPLLVMNTVLGGSFTSRLNTRLREERGYTYGAGSIFDMRASAGPFSARAGVFTDVTDSALVVFMREIWQLRDEPVGADELSRAKNNLALGFPGRFETAGETAALLADAALYGLPPEFFTSYVERVLAVTASDVQRVAREYLDPDRLVIVVAGDREKIEARLAPLGLGPVNVRAVPQH